MVYSSAPLGVYARDPTAEAQPKAFAFGFSDGGSGPGPSVPALRPLDTLRPLYASLPAQYPPASTGCFDSPGSASSAAYAPLEWTPPELLPPASPASSCSMSSASTSTASPASSPSPPLSLSGQPVLSDDQLLHEMFQRSRSFPARRFPSLSMDDAMLCGQMLGLPYASQPPTANASANTSGFLATRGLAAPPPVLAIPSPMGYNRAFSSPPMLASARRPPFARAALHHASLSMGKKKAPASRICRMPGCTKGIRSRGLCKAHGGGRRCQTPGCEISDQGGGHCIAHGGGRRCSVAGCQKSAQSKGLCKLHGGARLCRMLDCSKNGQIKGLCRLHYSLLMASAGPQAVAVAGRGRL